MLTARVWHSDWCLRKRSHEPKKADVTETAASWDFMCKLTGLKEVICAWDTFAYMKHEFCPLPRILSARRSWQGLKALHLPRNDLSFLSESSGTKLFHLEQICWPEFLTWTRGGPKGLQNYPITSNETMEEEQTRLDLLLLESFGERSENCVYNCVCLACLHGEFIQLTTVLILLFSLGFVPWKLRVSMQCCWKWCYRETACCQASSILLVFLVISNL